MKSFFLSLVLALLTATPTFASAQTIVACETTIIGKAFDIEGAFERLLEIDQRLWGPVLSESEIRAGVEKNISNAVGEESFALKAEYHAIFESIYANAPPSQHVRALSKRAHELQEIMRGLLPEVNRVPYGNTPHTRAWDRAKQQLNLISAWLDILRRQ